MPTLPNRQAARRRNPELLKAAAELRRQRDRDRLEQLWARLSIDKCGLCREGKPGPRCAACLLRGLQS